MGSVRRKERRRIFVCTGCKLQINFYGRDRCGGVGLSGSLLGRLVLMANFGYGIDLGPYVLRFVEQ